jgi:hypothetical protein
LLETEREQTLGGGLAAHYYEWPEEGSSVWKTKRLLLTDVDVLLLDDQSMALETPERVASLLNFFIEGEKMVFQIEACYCTAFSETAST